MYSRLYCIINAQQKESKSEVKSVQLARDAFVINDFLRNPHFNTTIYQVLPIHEPQAVVHDLSHSTFSKEKIVQAGTFDNISEIPGFFLLIRQCHLDTSWRNKMCRLLQQHHQIGLLTSLAFCFFFDSINVIKQLGQSSSASVIAETFFSQLVTQGHCEEGKKFMNQPILST